MLCRDDLYEVQIVVQIWTPFYDQLYKAWTSDINVYKMI